MALHLQWVDGCIMIMLYLQWKGNVIYGCIVTSAQQGWTIHFTEVESENAGMFSAHKELKM